MHVRLLAEHADDRVDEAAERVAMVRAHEQLTLDELDARIFRAELSDAIQSGLNTDRAPGSAAPRISFEYSPAT